MGITVREFVDMFISVYGRNISVNVVSRREGDTTGAYANCDKTNKAFDWKVQLTAEDGIMDALRWEKHWKNF